MVHTSYIRVAHTPKIGTSRIIFNMETPDVAQLDNVFRADNQGGVGQINLHKELDNCAHGELRPGKLTVACKCEQRV